MKLTQRFLSTPFSSLRGTSKNMRSVCALKPLQSSYLAGQMQEALSTVQNRSFHVNRMHFEEASVEQEPALAPEVEKYLEKNSPITIAEGKVIQSQLLEKVKAADFSSVSQLPHDSIEALQAKWFKALEAISAIRAEVLKQNPQFNGDEERMKVWLGRLSNHSESIKKGQEEFTRTVAAKLFGIQDFEPQITDTRVIGIFYQADKIVQEEMLQRQEFAGKSLREFAKGKVYDANTQKDIIFPRLMQEELKLLKIEQEQQNEYRADIRKQVEEAKKEMEAAGKTLELIEGADKIQKELTDMDTPLGWIQYKLQLGQAYYRFG